MATAEHWPILHTCERASSAVIYACELRPLANRLTAVIQPPAMKVDEAVSHYGTLTALAEALAIQPSAVSNWKVRHNGRVPELYAYKLNRLTRGRLKIDPRQYQ